MLSGGETVPQFPSGLVQAMLQSTPASVWSFSTVASRFTVSPLSAAPSVNAAGETFRLIAGTGVMVTLALVVILGSLIDAAVIVTGPDGGAAGAI
jgi:hypothetical protein